MVDKTAIIIAASKGMGAACARELSERGYNLILMARSESVKEIAEELGAVAYQGSVTEFADLEAVVALAKEKFGRIDAVVNNTGHPPKGDLLGITDENWHFGLDLCLLNVVRMARLVVPMMEEQGSGAFVNISAFGAKEPDLVFPVSASIRAALSSFTKLFADRYAANNIRMNSVLPGFVENFDVADAWMAKIPANRAAKLEEIAKTVAFLLSDDAGYINGQNIVVDGGLNRSI